MTNMNVLQIQVATTTFVPDEPAATDGVQTLVAFVQSDSKPVSGQVWDARETTGLPWTVQKVQTEQQTHRASALTMSRPASQSDRLPAPGQVLDLVQQPVSQLRTDWRRPFRAGAKP